MVQQRNGLRGSVSHLSPEAAEQEADTVSQRSIVSPAMATIGARPISPAFDEQRGGSWADRLRHEALSQVRRLSGEALGTVEGVATEAATMIDTVVDAGPSLAHASEIVVDQAATAAGLTPRQREIAHLAVAGAISSVVPGAGIDPRLQPTLVAAGGPQGRSYAARGVTWVFNQADRGRVALVGQGAPEYGIFTAREMGLLEGAIGSQIALLFVDAEEVQLALRGLGALGSLEQITQAIENHPDTWMHDPEFVIAVVNAALFVIGLHASSVGARLRELLVDALMGGLALIGPVRALANDYQNYHEHDRTAHLNHDLQALIRAVAQAVITAIQHARQARARAGSSATPETPPTGQAPTHATTPASETPRAVPPASTAATPVRETPRPVPPASTAITPVPETPRPGPPPRRPTPGSGDPAPRPQRRGWVHPDTSDTGHFHPLTDVPVEHGRGSGMQRGERLATYADAARSTARKNPATAAAHGESGPYIHDNLYTGGAQTRAVSNLEAHGIIEPSGSGRSMRVVDPERYVQWLERAYRQHGEAHLNPQMREAIQSYVSSGEPIGVYGTDPQSGATSFAGALPGTHAELMALNDVLNAGGGNPVTVSTVRARTGAHFVACAHCSGIINRLPPSVRAIVSTGVVTPVP